MSVTTGSLGTEDASASSLSLCGLDGVNFFLAAALAGFGPYVAAYLADQNWTQADIGFVLTAGGVAGLLSQVPGGELLDKIRSKRALVAGGAGVVTLSGLIIAIAPKPFSQCRITNQSKADRSNRGPEEAARHGLQH